MALNWKNPKEITSLLWAIFQYLKEKQVWGGQDENEVVGSQTYLYHTF